MVRGSLVLVLLLCVGAAMANKKKLTIGYLTAVKGRLKDRQGLAVSGAITFALEQINQDPDLLPGVTLELRWNDTKGETVATTRAITDMLCDGVAAFFGPEGSCEVEAIVAQSRNIPMISYKCSDYKPSSVPTFARTEPPNTQVTKSLISLLRYYGWKKFSIITEETWVTVSKNLENEAKKNNFTINHVKVISDRHKCCELSLPCCQSGFWYDVIQHTRNRTRIYIFLGTPVSLVEMMSTMQALQIFENGDYMVIYVDMMTYSSKEATKYLWKPTTYSEPGTCLDQVGFQKRAQSLLVVVPSPPAQDYQNFTEIVRLYNTKEPFNFHLPSVFLNVSYMKFVSIYAAYLYDSVKLYARALDQLLREEAVQTDADIERIAMNGSRIIETIIKSETYQSITGATIKLDRNGDSEGNFSVLAFKPYNWTDGNFSCPYHMVPVGQFQQGDTPEYKSKLILDWAGGRKPEEEPSCGFDDELCPKDDSQNGSILVAGILGLMLFCAIVITLSIYRKWKIEQEIEGLLWKIDLSDLIGYNDMAPNNSRVSIVSAISFESRCGPQVFADTAQYKGVVVRVKEIKFSRKKDISREIMKEMRLLREFHHDNVNAFIGAVVNPTKISVVTDYCAKGSLYDIVENEDIKLDKIFIVSLVNDLVKGMMFLHSSFLGVHGNLKSSNCVITSRWVLQVTDFGLFELRHCPESESIGEHQYFRSLLWTAPEILRRGNPCKGTQKGDVYAFAIILHELIGRRGPFGACGLDEPKEIIQMVKHVPTLDEDPFRPNIDLIRESELGNDPGCEIVINVMRDAWLEDPDLRPDFPSIRAKLKTLQDGKKSNILDQMMEKYTTNLEELVMQRTMEVQEEKQKTEDLLHRMLPAPVAKRLTCGYGVEPESFDLVTIYFSDIVGFTAMSAESTPLQVVNFLNDLYTLFDRIIKGYDVYKVETIGDAYMVVSGLPLKNGDAHAGEIASMSLDLLMAVKNHSIAHRPNETLKLRIGIHTGPVVAGVVGLTMPRYCLFGDTVNTASRMESNGEPLRIHISDQCKVALEKLGGYQIEPRGKVSLKGKGLVNTYWLTGASDAAIKPREVDLTNLPPPLFCRPRKSPKGGFNDSRRQSSAISTRATSLPPTKNFVRVAQSLDPFPTMTSLRQTVKRSCHSLQEKGASGGVSNGILANEPLLSENKRWHSLETVPAEPCTKKLPTGSSLRSWLFGLFNNTSFRNSDVSLRKVGYQDLQPERESIV